jgi:hypothetical protein
MLSPGCSNDTAHWEDVESTWPIYLILNPATQPTSEALLTLGKHHLSVVVMYIVAYFTCHCLLARSDPGQAGLGFRFRVLINLFCAPNRAPLGEYLQVNDSPRNDIVIMRSTSFFHEFHSRLRTGEGRVYSESGVRFNF